MRATLQRQASAVRELESANASASAAPVPAAAPAAAPIESSDTRSGARPLAVLTANRRRGKRVRCRCSAEADALAEAAGESLALGSTGQRLNRCEFCTQAARNWSKSAEQMKANEEFIVLSEFRDFSLINNNNNNLHYVEKHAVLTCKFRESNRKHRVITVSSISYIL